MYTKTAQIEYDEHCTGHHDSTDILEWLHKGVLNLGTHALISARLGPIFVSNHEALQSHQQRCVHLSTLKDDVVAEVQGGQSDSQPTEMIVEGLWMWAHNANLIL